MPTVTINRSIRGSEILADLRQVLGEERDPQIKEEFRALLARLEARSHMSSRTALKRLSPLAE